MDEFRLTIDDLVDYGTGLTRPECVLCLKSGTIFTSNGDGGVTRIDANGECRHILGDRYRPMTNGFALTAEGDFLIADLRGDGVWRMGQDGTCAPFLRNVDGIQLGSTNFVGVDSKGRIWATISTEREPRQLAYRGDVADGYIVLIEKDGSGARIVADNIGYTNEAIVDPSGEWLVVNETFARRTSRYAIDDDGSLGRPETLTEYGAGTYPDGLAFDEEGAIWVTSVVSNRLIRVTPDGGQTLIFEDCDAEVLAAVEDVFQAGEMGSEHMAKVVSQRARSISSIAFGGPDRRTAYLGNLLDDRLYSFKSPVAGAAPSHWELDL
jgi:sugar lactone lactonase YvrE